MRKRKKANRAPTATRARADKPTTHDAYLAAVSEDKRVALQKLRRAIRSAAPDAEECISYGAPAFRLNGKLLVAYSATTKHCSFYPGATVQSFKQELKDYDTGKGTVRFPASRPLPPVLVRKLVKFQIGRISR